MCAGCSFKKSKCLHVVKNQTIGFACPIGITFIQNQRVTSERPFIDLCKKYCSRETVLVIPVMAATFRQSSTLQSWQSKRRLICN
jgi:hypothetical protein